MKPLYFINSNVESLFFPLEKKIEKSSSKKDVVVFFGFGILIYNDGAWISDPMSIFDLEYMYKPQYLFPNYHEATATDIIEIINKLNRYEDLSNILKKSSKAREIIEIIMGE